MDGYYLRGQPAHNSTARAISMPAGKTPPAIALIVHPMNEDMQGTGSILKQDANVMESFNQITRAF